MEGEGEGDRMSQLPDPILQHILSFTDINQAVQTTTLSTRWKCLCFSLSDLHFRLSSAAALAGVSLKNRRSARAFSLFISRYLSHRDAASPIGDFHLSFDSRLVHVDVEFVEKCVSYAVDHSVEFLHLHTLSHQTRRLPTAFFSSKLLRELKLSQFIDGIYLPKEFSLPSLKTLYLEESASMNDAVDVHYCSYRKEPFSGFPELETLTLRQSIRDSGLVISAPSFGFLKSFITHCIPKRYKRFLLLCLLHFIRGQFSVAVFER